MGSWNSTPFGNDAALDWVAELVRNDQAYRFIRDALEKIGPNWGGDVTNAEEAIAAASAVSAAAVEPIARTNQDLKSWVATTAFVPDAELLQLADSAIARICRDSELRDLWDEAESLDLWVKQTQKVLSNIRAAQERGLPSRKPRRRGLPRSLIGLLKRHAEEPSEELKARLNKLVSGLADPNDANSGTDYREPLSLVASYGLVEEARVLIERGAEVDTGSPSPFVAACIGGHLETARFLFDVGAKVFFEVEPKPDAGPLNMLVNVSDSQMGIQGIQPKAPGYRYCLALFSVARHGAPQMAEFLIELGADLNQTDLNDENLLHKASESGNLSMLEFLLDGGLNINKVKGQFADSPLHYAVRAGQLEAVRFLLGRSADPNIINKFEGSEHRWYETPLDIAENQEIRLALEQYGGKGASEIMSKSTAD